MNQKGIAPIIIILIVIGVLAVGGGVYYLSTKQVHKQVQKIVDCTGEAKFCPDGTSVGRTGPNCEFAACPVAKANDTSNWQTYRNEEYGFEVKYPKDWKKIEGDKDFYVFFKQDDNNQIGILPNGGLDYGLPFSDPIVKNITIDNRNAVRKEWLRSQNILIIVNFTGNPINWNKYHRIDIRSSPDKVSMINQILSTFKFTD